MEYRVKWEIDIEADTPEEAARAALDKIMYCEEGICHIFVVRDKAGIRHKVDFGEEHVREGEPPVTALPPLPENHHDELVAMLETSVKRMREVAAPIGPLHAFWDDIFDAEILIQKVQL